MSRLVNGGNICQHSLQLGISNTVLTLKIMIQITMDLSADQESLKLGIFANIICRYNAVCAIEYHVQNQSQE